jgi:hypothetical protein
MSGCAVCVYDLYEEILASYKESVEMVRVSLTKKQVPSSTWPADIQLSLTAPHNAKLKPDKSVVLNAFEDMERRLREKHANERETRSAS